MGDRQQLNLEVERLRTERFVEETLRDTYIPMPVAAAMTFHELHGRSKRVVYRDEYDAVLDLAAAALSRLIPVYTLSKAQEPIEAKADLLLYRFTNGATQLRARDGGSLLEPLWVQRSRLLSASSFIRRAGFAYSFSVVPDARSDGKLATRDGSERHG